MPRLLAVRLHLGNDRHHRDLHVVVALVPFADDPILVEDVDRWPAHDIPSNRNRAACPQRAVPERPPTDVVLLETRLQLVEVLVTIDSEQGKWLAGVGKQVVAPELLRDVSPDVVVAMNSIYCDEIRGGLDAMNVAAKLMTV